jgi:hypothetical protein
MILQSILASVAISPLLWLLIRNRLPEVWGHPVEEFLWVEVPESAVGRSPAWMRRVILAPDGTIYLPVAFGGDEQEMTARAIRDGVYPVTSQAHTFAPADWLAKVAPEKADLCAGAQRAAIHFFTGYVGP